MSLSEITSMIEDHNKKLDELTKEFQGKIQSMFTDVTKAFFEETPEVYALVWNQYTPYFNDGEECVFSINDIYAVGEEDYKALVEEEGLVSAYEFEDYNIEAYDENDIKFYKERIEQYPNDSYYKTRYERTQRLSGMDPRIHKNISSIVNMINSNEDIMRSMYGDHVVVHLTRDGTTAEDYDHE